MTKPVPLPRERVHRYANFYRERSERRGQGSAYPTVRLCARRLRMTQAAVLQAAEDARDWGLPLDIAVGVQIGGGGGYGLHDTPADYELETWPDETVPATVAARK